MLHFLFNRRIEAIGFPPRNIIPYVDGYIISITIISNVMIVIPTLPMKIYTQRLGILRDSTLK